MSLPAWGVCIEIKFNLVTDQILTQSLPARGVRIEILCSRVQIGRGSSLPVWGVCIEIWESDK